MITPAFHYVSLSYTATEVSYDDAGRTYFYRKNSVKEDDFVGLLTLEKDFGNFSVGLFGGAANLNSSEQFQFGVSLTAYPSGTPDLWSRTRLLSHSNDGNQNLVLEQATGFRATGKLWGQVYFTVGPMVNYFNSNGYIVYNTEYIIKMIGGTRWTLYAGKNITVSLDYKFFWRKAEYLQYYLTTTGNGELSVLPGQKDYTFITHLILGGITWKI
jgi:hypothetical protein